MKLQFFRSLFFQRLDEWLAVLMGFGAGIYILRECLRSAMSGLFAYHTRLNFGQPVPISLTTDPFLFVGLVMVQIGFAIFLVHSIGWWGLRHILRRTFPSLGWSARDNSRMPGLWVILFGSLIIAVGLMPVVLRIF